MNCWCVKYFDFTSRAWGHDLTFTPRESGQFLDAAGWTTPLPKQGDYAILASSGRTTRYRFINVRWCGDPEDMWFAILKFAPRI